MIGDIQRELLLLTEIDNINGSEAIKTLSICSNFLNCDEYMNEVNQLLDNIFVQQDFNLFTEIGHVISSLVRLNNRAKYYKEVPINRMKYVMYSAIYTYMIKNKLDFFNSLDIGLFRLCFSNAWLLVELLPQTVQIMKRSLFSCCSGGNINIK